MLNITRDTGEFLDVLVRATSATSILEIGTSNGYSTLWLARAAVEQNARLVTLESNPAKVEMARACFERAGLTSAIELIEGDAGRYLIDSPADEFDFVFHDSERPLYVGWWSNLDRVMVRGALLVVDNATSHAPELEAFVRLLDDSPVYRTVLVPIGNGELLAWKRT
jgi:predicted O-methyltransferase YrrM